MPDWTFVTEDVLTRVGMWTGRPTYERAVCFVIGFDAAQDRTINDLLQERVRARHKTGPLGWEWVLQAEAIGADVHNPPDLGGLTPEQDQAAVALLRREIAAVTQSAS